MVSTFDDEATLFEQRLIWIIYASTVILATLVYLTYQLVRSIQAGIIRRKKYIFLTFYLCIEVACLFRFFYCLSGKWVIPVPTIVYGILGVFPSVFTTTATLLFLLSMVQSLCELYEPQRAKRFDNLKVVIYLLIFWLWAVSIDLFAAMLYYDGRKSDFPWITTFFVHNTGINALICGGLVSITAIYIRELKNFTYTYKERKVAVYLMLGVTLLQLACKVVQSWLHARSVMVTWFNDESIKIWYFVYSCFFVTLSDILPAIGYVIYLRKEVQAQVSIENSKTDAVSTTQSSAANVASMLERLYKKKELQLRQDPDPGLLSGRDNDTTQRDTEVK